MVLTDGQNFASIEAAVEEDTGRDLGNLRPSLIIWTPAHQTWARAW